MSMLLMLLLLDVFIHSSQAVKCYLCKSGIKGDCDDPFDSEHSQTCSGEVCTAAKYEERSGIRTIIKYYFIFATV